MRDYPLGPSAHRCPTVYKWEQDYKCFTILFEKLTPNQIRVRVYAPGERFSFFTGYRRTKETAEAIAEYQVEVHNRKHKRILRKSVKQLEDQEWLRTQ